MALKGRDKAIRDRFTLTHTISDRANLKKYDVLRVSIEGIAKQLPELLPDDYATQEEILKSLDSTLGVARRVFEVRSAAVPAEMKVKTRAKAGNVVKTQPLRTAANPQGRPTPVVETTPNGHAVEVGGTPPVSDHVPPAIVTAPIDQPRSAADAATA